MPRCNMLRGFSRFKQSIFSNRKDKGSEFSSYRTVVTVGLRLPHFRVYNQYNKFPAQGRPTFSVYEPQRRLYRSYLFRIYSLLSESNAVTHHAQVAWKKLSRKYSSNSWCFPRVNTIAQAVCLALTRSHVLVPSIFAIACGKVAWAQKPSGLMLDHCLSQNSFYESAKDGHIFLSSSVLSVVEGLVLFVRVLYLAVLFSPSILMAPFAECCGTQFRELWLEIVHRTLEKAGPAFIKWGQWAATRPDLFPRDLCTKLSELHSKAPEHAFAYTKKTIERAFGRTISEIFEDFEETPVASGSIAQVHRASLKFRYPGREVKPTVVAVKVRHPGVGESIRRDFVIINMVAKLSNLVPALKWLRLDESVQQFAVFMMSQVDLAREAAQLNRFIHNFRGWKDVSFPKPVYPLVHPAVLVETYEQGESVARYVDDLEGHDWIKARIADLGTHALLKMLLVDNFIHADLHPGNILVRVPQKNSSRRGLFKSKPQVIFLDVGMTAELSKSDRENLVTFFKAVSLRDGRTAAECALRLSKQQNCPDPNAFIEEVGEAFTFWGTPEADVIHPADCMHELLEKVRRHKVNIDGNVCTVMVTTLVLEGWQRKLDPGYDMMHTLQKMVLKADWAKSLSYTIDCIMAP